MKKIFFLTVKLLFIPCLFSQPPNRYAFIISVISGDTNYFSLTSSFSDATTGMMFRIEAGTYKEFQLIIRNAVPVTGGFQVSTANLSQCIYSGKAATAQLTILDRNYEHRVPKVYGTLDESVITKGYVDDSYICCHI